MSAFIDHKRERIAHSERFQATVLACFSGLLGVVFIALLVADEVQAAAF